MEQNTERKTLSKKDVSEVLLALDLLLHANYNYERLAGHGLLPRDGADH